MANATLPSALVRFTSEFGMGSGGTTPLWPPGKLVCKGSFPLPSEDLVKSADCVFVFGVVGTAAFGVI